ncbi:MAG: patatin-like phospholipase family protein [Melioribacteraceae bacterium]|nr:patatin-like phospholipase family protein [Melioribacteraceae bacterium]
MAKISKILFVLFVSLAIIGQEKRELDLKLSSKQLPFGLTKLESEYNPKVYLSLSGGGARAVSQLGVLKAFEENDIRFDGIVGTSMGSIIGGLYSAGYSLNQLDSQIVRAPWEEFFAIEQTIEKELFPIRKLPKIKRYSP